MLRELLAIEDELTRLRGQRLNVSEYVKQLPRARETGQGGARDGALFERRNASAAAEKAPRTLGAGPGEPATPLSSYEILGELGRGGMGIVYRAFDHSRGQIVALKTLKHLDPGLCYRFKREFRTVADISHPNLATLHELVSDGRDLYLAMELVDGINLLEYIRSGPRGSSARPTDGHGVHDLPATTGMFGRNPW